MANTGSIAALKAEIDANVIPNNNDQEITGAGVNTTLKDLVDTLNALKSDPVTVSGGDLKVGGVATGVKVADSAMSDSSTAPVQNKVVKAYIDARDMTNRVTTLETALTSLKSAGYVFAGVATPATDPGTPTQKVFYVANAGTYSDFGGIVVPDGQIGILYYDTIWDVAFVDITPALDATPTAGSTRGVTSGGVSLALDHIKSIVEIGTVYDTEIDSTITLNGYINSTGKIAAYASQRVYAFPVEAGKSYLIQGSNRSSAGENYVHVAYFDTLPDIGVTATTILRQGALDGAYEDVYFTPSADGWICCGVRSTGYSAKCYLGEERWQHLDDVKTDKALLGLGMLKKEEQTASITINGYINSAGKIAAYASSKVYAFAVTAGQSYLIQGSNRSSAGENYVHVAFFDTEPDIDVVATTILRQGELDGPYDDVNFTPDTNGWICCYVRSTNYSAKCWTTEYGWKYKETLDNIGDISDLLSSIYPLMGKTVCVMGDSIMQNMCEPNLPTNTTTFVDVTGTDPTIYTEDDITVVNGYAYVTSTLVEGEVTEDSIRVDAVNSNQTALDNKVWQGLKDKTKAADVFVTAMGGGRIVEDATKIMTAYPARHPSGYLNGKMEDLPNQVRQLLRVVNDGIHNAPDCVVIWMGVNGSDTIITDTLDEAMAVDWDTLSDDQLGLQYRGGLYGAMRYAIESIYRAYPYTNIFIVSPVQNSRGDLKIDGSGPAYRGYTTLNSVATAQKAIAQRYACMYVDALHEISMANFSRQADTLIGGNEISTGTNLGNLVPEFLNPVATDGLHPNAKGKILWCNYLVSQLKARFFPKKDS